MAASSPTVAAAPEPPPAVVPVPPPRPSSRCPDRDLWGPEMYVKLGRRPGKVLVAETCFRMESLDGALDRLLETSNPCRLYTLWVTSGYLPERQADTLNKWWADLPATYWDDLSHRQYPMDAHEWTLAALPPTEAFPGYIDEKTLLFQGRVMARLLTIANLSGAVLTIDLHAWTVMPPRLVEFLTNPLYVKFTYQWTTAARLLTRRFGACPVGKGLTDLAQLAAGWLDTLPVPVTSLEQMGLALVGETEAMAELRYWLGRSATVVQSLLPLACDETWVDVTPQAWYMCIWMLDLALLNFTPGNMVPGGDGDPVTATLHRLYKAHWRMHPQDYPLDEIDRKEFCMVFRGAQGNQRPERMLYYDSYRALMLRYLPAGIENAAIFIFSPLAPDSRLEDRFPTVHEVVTDNWSLVGPWFPEATSDGHARMQLRSLFAQRQQMAERVDLKWMEELSLGDPVPIVRMTRRDIDAYAWWIPYRQQEILGVRQLLEAKFNSMGHIGARLRDIQLLKRIGSDGQGQVARWETMSRSVSQLSIAATGSAHGPQSSGTQSPSTGFPAVPSASSHSSSVPGDPPSIAPSDSATALRAVPPASKPPPQLVPAPAVAVTPVGPRNRRAEENRARSYPLGTAFGRYLWGKAPPVPRYLTASGRPHRLRNLPADWQQQEVDRREILKQFQRFLDSYEAYGTSPSERDRRDFMFAVLYAQFPDIATHPATYAFHSPTVVDVSNKRLAARPIVPFLAVHGNWWEEQHRLLSDCNPRFRETEALPMLLDFIDEDATPLKIFQSALSSAQIYWSTYNQGHLHPTHARRRFQIQSFNHDYADTVPIGNLREDHSGGRYVPLAKPPPRSYPRNTGFAPAPKAPATCKGAGTGRGRGRGAARVARDSPVAPATLPAARDVTPRPVVPETTPKPPTAMADTKPKPSRAEPRLFDLNAPLVLASFPSAPVGPEVEPDREVEQQQLALRTEAAEDLRRRDQIDQTLADNEGLKALRQHLAAGFSEPTRRRAAVNQFEQPASQPNITTLFEQLTQQAPGTSSPTTLSYSIPLMEGVMQQGSQTRFNMTFTLDTNELVHDEFVLLQRRHVVAPPYTKALQFVGAIQPPAAMVQPRPSALPAPMRDPFPPPVEDNPFELYYDADDADLCMTPILLRTPGKRSPVRSRSPPGDA